MNTPGTSNICPSHAHHLSCFNFNVWHIAALLHITIRTDWFLCAPNLLLACTCHPGLVSGLFLAACRMTEKAKLEGSGMRREYRDSCISHHSNWTYMFWDKAAAVELLRSRYPWFTKTFLSYEFVVSQGARTRERLTVCPVQVTLQTQQLRHEARMACVGSFDRGQAHRGTLCIQSNAAQPSLQDSYRSYQGNFWDS